MSFIFSRCTRHLKKHHAIGATINLFGIYSNKCLSNQHVIFNFSTYSEVTHRLPDTIGHFLPRKPKISYQYSDPIQIYNEQKQGSTVDNPVTFLVIDLGTTGLNSTKDQITDIAIRDLKGGQNSMFHMLLNPDETLKNHKPNQILVASSVQRCGFILLAEWIKICQKDSELVILVAHNGDRFDFPFLVRAFRKNGLDIPEDWLFLDSLPIARQLYYPDGTKLGKGNHNLKSIVTLLGVDVEASVHKSIQDVNALSSVLQQAAFLLKLTEMDLLRRAYTPSRYIVRPHYRI